MPQLIEIEGELARIIDRKILREVALADLITNIETRLPVTTPVLPDRTRMFHLDPSDNTRWTLQVLIETPPAVRTLTMSYNGNEATHRLALPYTIFAFHLYSLNQGTDWIFDDYDCLFSKETITNTDQWVIPALLPNIFDNGRICFGNTAPALNHDATITERLNAIVNEFYLTNFSDVGHTRERYMPWHGRKRQYGRWERETTTNARCWTTWPEFDADDTSQEHITIGQVLSNNRGRPIRTTPITLPNAIPDLAFIPTFGYAEQWFDGLTGTQRRRLTTAIANWQTTHELGDEPTEPADNDEDADDNA